MSELQSRCAVCQSPAKSSCSGCHAVFYCGRPHQKTHWKQHKPNCVPYKIAECAELGRHLVAARNLKPGEMVLSNRPLVVGPKQFSDALCLGCYRPVGADSHRCRCGYPMCGPACAAAPAHRPECEATRRSGQRLQVDVTASPNPLYQLVMLLRCLALRGSDGWQQLEQLQSHDEQRQLSGRQADIDEPAVQLLHQLGVDVSRELVYRVCGVLDVNGFEASTRGVLGLYPRAALLEHNCSPNTSRTFYDDLTLMVRASRPIAKGEHITTSYTDPLWGTDNRRYFLRQSKFFDCMCRRCADPSELGAELSSLRCPSCADGVVRCSLPLQLTASWSCNSCSRHLTADEVNEIVQYVGEKLVNIEKGSVAAAERFVTGFASVLTPTHFYMCDVKTALCLLYGKEGEDESIPLTYAEADRKQQLATELLDVLEKVNPGQNRLRAILLYELQTAILRRAQLEVEQGSLKPPEWRTQAQECMEYLRESSEVLQREPSVSSERHMAERAAAEYEALVKVLAVTGYHNAMAGQL